LCGKTLLGARPGISHGVASTVRNGTIELAVAALFAASALANIALDVEGVLCASAVAIPVCIHSRSTLCWRLFDYLLHFTL
jgi:hypothetical protein